MINDKLILLSRLMTAWQQALFLKLNSTNLGTHVVAKHVFMELQRKLRPQMSLEIGAHRAEFSQSMRGMFPEIEAVAFEASPVVHKHYSASEDFEGKGIAYLNMAVAEADGSVQFNVLSEANGISGRNSLQDRPELPGTKIEVPCVNGDSFLKNYAHDNIALWIDVEGAAGKVLPGLKESLRASRFSSIFIEVEGTEMWPGQWQDHQVTAFMAGQGYLPVYCDAEHCPPAFGQRQYNLVFMPQASLTAETLDWIIACYLDTSGRLEIIKRD